MGKIYNNIHNQPTIVIFENEIEWATHLSSQLSVFDFQTIIISLYDDFFTFLEQHTQDDLVLLINIDLIDQNAKTNLLLLQKQHALNNKIIFFLATSGEISYRLKAIQLGGENYLIKPFAIEELISKVEKFYHATEKNKILLIEDDQATAKAYAAILDKAGMQTKINHHYQQVLPTLSEFHPDLILMDLYMPECSGVELTAIIRQQSVYDSVPIVYLSEERNRDKQLHALSLGGDDFIHKNIRYEDLIYMIRNKINRYRTLRSFMVKDGLTGVFNHTHILSQLELSLMLTKRTHNPLSIVMIDLDNFKKINDTYSHPAGDHVLKSLCLLMKKRLRATDIIGRYGGEEFLIIFPNTNAAAAKHIIEELKEQFSAVAHQWNMQNFYLSFSAGIASYPDYHNTSALLQAADKALYHAKTLGRSRVEIIND